MYAEQIEKTVFCPYCGEAINVLIDGSLTSQEYIEDCQVCCRPILFKVRVEAEQADVQVFSENE